MASFFIDPVLISSWLVHQLLFRTPASEPLPAGEPETGYRQRGR